MRNIFETTQYNEYLVGKKDDQKEIQEIREDKTKTLEQISSPQVGKLSPLERMKQFERKKEVNEEAQIRYIYLEESGSFYDTTTDIEYIKTDVFRRKLSIELDKKITDDEVRYMVKAGEIQKKRGVIWHPKGKEGYYNRFNPRSLIYPSHTPILDEGIDILLSSISGYNEKNKDWLHRAIFYKWANPEDVRVPAVILYGVGSSGKSTYIELLKRVFGQSNVMGNLRQGELTGNFDTVTGDKLVYEFSEITAFNSNTDRQMLSKIKNLVFAPTITVNQKYRAPYQSDNFGWFFITSNAMRPVILDNGDSGNRRFVAFHSKKALIKEEANNVYKALDNPEVIANYLAWLHQEYSEVLDYKEMYRIENDDIKLLVQNSSSEIDEINTFLRNKYNGQRVHIQKIYAEISAFAEREKQNPSNLLRLFKAQSPFLKDKGTVEGIQGSQYYYEIV